MIGGGIGGKIGGRMGNPVDSAAGRIVVGAVVVGMAKLAGPLCIIG